jgi:hypothetical protein
MSRVITLLPFQPSTESLIEPSSVAGHTKLTPIINCFNTEESNHLLQAGGGHKIGVNEAANLDQSSTVINLASLTDTHHTGN